MKFYLASGLENRKLVQYVRDRLLQAGHHQTYDWTKMNEQQLKLRCAILVLLNGKQSWKVMLCWCFFLEEGGHTRSLG